MVKALLAIVGVALAGFMALILVGEQDIYTEVTIDVSAEHLWRRLVGFDDYGDWNPYIKKAKGSIDPESELVLTLAPQDTAESDATYVVQDMVPQKLLKLRSNLAGVGFLFSMDYDWVLEELTPQRTRFIQVQRYRGLLVPFVIQSLKTKTRQSLVHMNRALKNLAQTP